MGEPDNWRRLLDEWDWVDYLRFSASSSAPQRPLFCASFPFAHSPQCLPPSSATPSPGQSTGVRTFKAPQNTNDQLTYFSQPQSSGPLPVLCWPSDGVYQQVYHRGAMGEVLTINRLASTEPVTAAESITLLNSQRQHRPTSPHATIYQPQVCIDLLCHILFHMADISP